MSTFGQTKVNLLLRSDCFVHFSWHVCNYQRFTFYFALQRGEVWAIHSHSCDKVIRVLFCISLCALGLPLDLETFQQRRKWIFENDFLHIIYKCNSLFYIQKPGRGYDSMLHIMHRCIISLACGHSDWRLRSHWDERWHWASSYKG